MTITIFLLLAWCALFITRQMLKAFIRKENKQITGGKRNGKF